MPKGMARSSTSAPKRTGSRRGSIDLSSGGGGDSGRKRGLSRTMTAIGMAAPEDVKSTFDMPEPAPEPAASAATAADTAADADQVCKNTLSPASFPPLRCFSSPGLRLYGCVRRASLPAMTRVVACVWGGQEAPPESPTKPTKQPKSIKKNRSETIQVGIRCRPLIGRDAGQMRCFDTAKRSLQANENAPIKEGKAAKDKLPWVFDNVFDEQSTVHDIHRDLTNEVIDSVMEGYHGTIFAYGQTGSGKTYTMVGDRGQDVPGVMSLGTKQMFEWIKDDDYRDYMVRVSYMEVYMERVRDLLNPANIGQELKVRQDTGGKGFYVECQEVVVTNEDQIYAMLDAVRLTSQPPDHVTCLFLNSPR
jgi:hypothetical protein